MASDVSVKSRQTSNLHLNLENLFHCVSYIRYSSCLEIIVTKPDNNILPLLLRENCLWYTLGSQQIKMGC
jgi:hypothetical protein